MRLDKYLSNLGVGSRELVKKMIRAGRVTVDDVTVKIPDVHVNDDSTVKIDGQTVIYSEFEYFLLHKPSGYLTANSDAKDHVVMELVPSKRPDLSPVGRLDKDTEGVLIVTNDGALSHKLLSPKNEIPKTYYFETDSDISETAAEVLKEPVVFKEFTSKPARLTVLTKRSGEITVTEGKYHEVKRLMHHVGSDVTYLKRISFAGIKLGALEKGAVRALTEDEINHLKSFS